MSIDHTPDATPAAPQLSLVKDFEDIAPGTIEVLPERRLSLYKVGGAAMVAAAKTGRAIGLTARPTWGAARYFGHGAKSVSYLGRRYVRAHDLQEVIGGMTSGADWNKVEETKRNRWKFLAKTSAWIAGLDVAGWWALVNFGDMTALDSWAILPGAELTSTVIGIALYGRYRLANPGMPAAQLLADDDMDDGEEPFPLAWCKDGSQVEECVGRALAAEGIGTRSVRCLGHRQWGWEIDIVLKGSKVAKVSSAADDLDAHFNIKRGGTLIDPDPSESAHLVLRLITASPFEAMPKPQVHAPNSLDIADAHNLGRCMDGTPLDLVLEGLRILVIGVSGAAKSTGVLRDLAEIITACHNAIAIEMDPVKDGLREFEGVMAVPPIRGNAECEEWLEHLVKMAEGRNVVRNRLKMGDNWVATKEHPAVFVFVDEFIYLSQKAKELFIRLLRLGKQTGIFPVAAGQDATSDSLGDAIADSFTLRVMLASRWEDIRLVLGQGAAAAGFRPDRLEPAQNKEIKNDAGQSYIKGAGLTRPLLYGWNEHSRRAIEKAVADRKTAGRPWFDEDTLAAAGLFGVIARAGGPAGESRLSGRLDVYAQQMGIEDARLVAVLLREFELSGESFLPTSERLLPALAEAGFADVDGGVLGRKLKAHAPGAAAGREEWEGRPQVRGWHRDTVEHVAAGLLNPPTARLQAD